MAPSLTGEAAGYNVALHDENHFQAIGDTGRFLQLTDLEMPNRERYRMACCEAGPKDRLT